MGVSNLIEHRICSFLWSDSGDKQQIHRVPWNVVTRIKQHGALNKSLLAKLGHLMGYYLMEKVHAGGT